MAQACKKITSEMGYISTRVRVCMCTPVHNSRSARIARTSCIVCNMLNEMSNKFFDT
jgi:hypothetical protein